MPAFKFMNDQRIDTRHIGVLPSVETLQRLSQVINENKALRTQLTEAQVKNETMEIMNHTLSSALNRVEELEAKLARAMPEEIAEKLAEALKKFVTHSLYGVDAPTAREALVAYEEWLSSQQGQGKI